MFLPSRRYVAFPEQDKAAGRLFRYASVTGLRLKPPWTCDLPLRGDLLRVNNATLTSASRSRIVFNIFCKPYAELSLANIIVYTFTWQIIGLLWLICQTILVKELGTAFALPGFVALLWLSIHNPLSAFITFLQILMYQNVVLSIFTPDMAHNSYVRTLGIVLRKRRDTFRNIWLPDHEFWRQAELAACQIRHSSNRGLLNLPGFGCDDRRFACCSNVVS